METFAKDRPSAKKDRPSAKSVSAVLCDPLTVLMAATGAGLFLAWGLFGVFQAPFPSQVDELQHLSFVRFMAQSPTLFPSYGHMPTLDPDLRRWTSTPNYLAHPPLYYLVLSRLPFDRLTLRLSNLGLAFSGVALAFIGLVPQLTTRRRRIVFALLIFLFPRTVTTACMINNDNLVMFETGLLMCVLGADRRRPLAVGAILALIGWTKLNAFVGLCAFVGLIQLQASWPSLGRRGLRAEDLRAWSLLAIGAAIGLAPVARNLIWLHYPVYTPKDFLYVDPAHRLSLDVFTYTATFIHRLALKFPPVEGQVDCSGLLFFGLAIASLGAVLRRSSAREVILARAGLGALAIFFGVHLYYGWRSFSAFGTLSEAQMRYYAMLWPALVFAFTIGADHLLNALEAKRQDHVVISRRH